jgi:uncharacterized membrane protein
VSKTLDVIAAVYATQEQADTILDTLQKMHRASTITLADAALVTKDGEGKIHVKETREVTTKKGAKRGAIVTGIIGLIYPPSLIASVVAGGAIGGAWGKIRDSGIKTGELKGIGTDLEPGKVAVVALAEPEWVPAIEQAMQAWDGQLVKHGFSAEESEEIEQAAEADEPEDAAQSDASQSEPAPPSATS